MIIIKHPLLIEYLAGLAMTTPRKFEVEVFGEILRDAHRKGKKVKVELTPKALEHYIKILEPINTDYQNGWYDKSKCIINGIDMIARYKQHVMPRMWILINKMKEELNQTPKANDTHRN